MTLIRSNQTVLSLLQERAHSAGETLYAAFHGQNLTIAELYQRVGNTVAELSPPTGLGITAKANLQGKGWNVATD